MHHLTFGINSLLHSVNLIVFTLTLAHLILRISPHHSHHLRSHHLSLPLPFTLYLTRSGTGCFIAVPMATVGFKGLTS